MTSFLNGFFNLTTLNKVNELKPTFGQEYLNAIGYDDKHEEICHNGTSNLEIASTETMVEMSVCVAEKFNSCDEILKALQISRYDMLNFIANEKSKFEGILKFFYQTIKGCTLLCSIYIVTHEATVIFASKSRNVSRPISKFLLGHHVILSLPLETHINDMEEVKRNINLLLTAQNKAQFPEYFLYEASAYIDYDLLIHKPAYELFNELLYQKQSDKNISLFMELPKLERKRSYDNFNNEHSALRFLLNLKKIIYLCEQKFGFESKYNVGKKCFIGTERDKLGDNIISQIQEFYTMDFLNFPPPQLGLLYENCKKYEKEYCFALYEDNAHLPKIHSLLDNYVASAFRTIKEMPFKKQDNIWIFEANDINSSEIRKKYLAGKLCIAFTDKTKNLIEPLFTPLMLWLSSKEKQMEHFSEPIILYDGTREYFFGMAKPISVERKKGEKGKYILYVCVCQESKAKKVWICWICKICKYLLKSEKDDYVYCECGTYKKCDFEKECFKCNKQKAEVTKTAEENCNENVAEENTEVPMKIEETSKNQNQNILLIGQCGTGKSMLVNSIYNYLTYDFDEVSTAQTVDCILPCHFQLQTPGLQKVLFTGGPQNANEHFNDNGESVTQKPKIYNLKTEKYICKVIDTPGLGDTRGAKQDAENVDLIRNAIIEIEELHAICFVMPSNISKLPRNFERNMCDLLSLFPKTALKNVFFFFTFANSPFFTIGDTRSSLEEFISTFEATNYAKIPFGVENVCCVDSEAFMYFIATTQGHKYQNRDLESFRISWDKSKVATENFLKKLEDISPIKTNDILMTYEFEQVGTLLQLETTDKNLERLIQHILVKISQISMKSKFNLKKKMDVESMEDFKTPEIFKALQICQNNVKDKNLKQFILKIIECYGNPESKKADKTGLQKPENSNKTNVTKLYKQKLVETLHLEENNIRSSKALCDKCREKESILSLLMPDDNTIFAFPKKIVDMNQDIDAVGIDLGTSRCCVAVNRKSGIETIGLDNTGGRLMPSYVSYDEEHPKCGQTVVDRLRNYSEATVFDSKRIIGKTIANIDKIWPFKVVNLNNQPTIVLKTQRGEIQQTATEVAAVLLKYMKEKAESFQGKKLSKAVITVPAAFTEAQEAATKKAAIIAGWETVTLLPEPIAASFAYFIDRPIPNNSILLLFDLGGGTLDVCVFKIISDQIQIISKNGDSKLGGRDFDNLLMDFFSNKLNMDYDVSKLGNNVLPNLNKDNSETMVNLKDIRDKKFKLLMESQKIKHNLSVHNEDHLDIGDIDPAKTGFIKISQQNFYDLSEDLLNKIQNTILSALYKSGYKANEINQVLHVGGGCRMAMIKKLLHEIFSSAKHWCEEHPDEVVAIGAAYYAYEIFSK